MSDADLVTAIERLLPHLANGRPRAKFTPQLKAQLQAAMPGLKERAKNLVELIDSARFLYADRPIASTTRRRCCSTRRRAPSSRS